MKIKVLLKNGLLGGLAITAVCIIHLRRSNTINADPAAIQTATKQLPTNRQSATHDIALVNHPKATNNGVPQ